MVRLDELLWKLLIDGEGAEAERVREVGRLGRRRAEMIAHNHKIDQSKRAEKAEIARRFAIWLETPDTLRLARAPQEIARISAEVRRIRDRCRRAAGRGDD